MTKTSRWVIIAYVLYYTACAAYVAWLMMDSPPVKATAHFYASRTAQRIARFFGGIGLSQEAAYYREMETSVNG